MPIEHYALTRLAFGVVSIAISIYKKGISDSGSIETDKTFESIFSQFVGGTVYDLTKTGASQTYSKLKAKYANSNVYDKDDLNHDLQKAARKSQLIATYFAVQHCLKKSNENDYASDKRLVNKLVGKAKQISGYSPKNTQKEYFEKVIQYLDQEIKDIESLPTGSITLDALELIKDYEKHDPANLESSISAFLKDDILDELKLKGILEGTELDPGSLNILKATIKNGWEELPKAHKGNEKFLNLSISNPKPSATGKKYDWFYLLCSIFIEEYKTNSKVQATIQKKLLQDISNQMSDRFGKLDSDLKYITQNISNLARDFAEFMVEDAEFKTQVKEDLQKILETTHPQYYNPQNFVGLPNLSDNVYGRKDELDKILEFLQGKHLHSAIIAPSCFGKTFLIKKFLSETINDKEVKDEYKNLFKKVIYLDCDYLNSLCNNNQFNYFSKITEYFAPIVGKSFKYIKDVNVNFLKHDILSQIQDEKILLIFDNFETWINSEEKFINSDIKVFIQTLLNTKHSIRLIFVSQRLPQNEKEFTAKIYLLEDIGEKLLDGLNQDDALDLIREEGEKLGLHKVNTDILLEFLKKINYIPQAIQSMIGYIASEGINFVTFRANYDEFNDNEAGEFNVDERQNKLRPTRTLLRMQIESLSADAKYILSMMAFLNYPAPAEILTWDLSDEEVKNSKELRTLRLTLNRLKKNCLLKTEIDEFIGFDPETGEEIKIIYYSLHPYIRQVIIENTSLQRFEKQYEKQLESFGDFLINEILQLKDQDHGLLKYEFVRKADALCMCSSVVEDYLINSLGKKNRDRHLATAQLTKVISLLSKSSVGNEEAENIRNAEEILLKVVKNFPDAETYYILATKRLQDEDYAGARDAFEQSIKINPNDSKSYTNLGICLYELEDYSGAEIYFLRAISLNPKDYYAYFNLADLQSKFGELVKAEQHFKKVIELNPGMPDAYKSLAAIQNILKKYSEAESNYVKTLELNPKDAQASYNLSLLRKGPLNRD